MRYRFDEIEIDVPRRQLRVDGAGRSVQPQVFDLLTLLVQERGRVLSKAELFERLWPDAIVSEASIQRTVSLARSALGRSAKRIRTYTRRGYGFEGDVAVEQDVVATEGSNPPTPAAAFEVRYANSGGVHIAYATHGQGPLDVAVILGWAMPFEALSWSPHLAALRDGLAGLGRLVLFDKRGTGLSDREATIPSLDARALDLSTVLDTAGSRRVLLVGVSEGGPLAIRVAAEYPKRVAGLLLMGAFARMASSEDHPEGWNETQITKLKRYIETRWGSGATAAAAIPSLAGEPGFSELCARIERSGASPGAALKLLETNLRTDVRSLLPNVRVPTQVVHTQNDQVIGYENGVGLAERIPGAKLVTLPGHDHIPVREVEAVIAAARQLRLPHPTQ